MVLLDFGVQPLMLGKVVVDGLRLIEANLWPMPISDFNINK
jgi:hypothetical protein